MHPQPPSIAAPSQNSIYPPTQSQLQQQQKDRKSSRSLSSMKYSDEEQIYEDDRDSNIRQQRRKKKSYVKQQQKPKKHFKMSQRSNDDGISKFVLIAFLGCVGVIVVVGLVMIGVNGGNNVTTNVYKTVDNDISANHNNDDDDDQDTNSKSLTKQKNSIIPKRAAGYTKNTLQTMNGQQGIGQSVVRYCGKDIDKTPKKLSQANNTNLREHYVQTNYGFNLYVDSKDQYVSRFVSTDGTWQPNYINIIGHIVKPGNKILNVGSQFGIEAVLMGKLIGSSGQMFIFQPYSFSNKLLTKNIQTNGLSHITTIYPIGASNTKSSAIIQVAYANTGGSEIVSSSTQRSRVNSNGQVVNEEEEVQLNSIDATLPSGTVLDFALLDVQKMEVDALKGMRETILRSPNLIIMCQWQYLNNKNRNEAQARSILKFMISRGYGIYSYRGGNPVTCEKGVFTEYSRPNQLLRIKNSDIFFIPKSHPRLSQFLIVGSQRNTKQTEKEQTRTQQEIVSKPVKRRENKIYCGSVVNQRPIKLNQMGQDPNERSKLVSTNYGFNMYVDLKDQDAANSIQNNGIWSSNKINQIGNILKPGNKILNLGSQVGIEAVLMGKLIGSQGQMFIFQPYSFSNKLVTKNIQINNLSNITTIYRIAASDTQSSGMIEVSYSSQGPNAGKQNSNGQAINEEEEVQMNTVDATLPQGIVLDFALLDVQMMEVEALKGMRQVILRSPNLIIMCEWQYLSNQNRNESDARQILQFMMNRGYGFFTYKNDNPSQCFVGSFSEYRRVEQLLRIGSEQIIMIPKRHPDFFSIISG